MKQYDTRANVYKDVKLIKANGQNKNLKRLLTRASFTSEKLGKVTKFGAQRCKLCEIIEECSSVKFNNSTFFIKTNMNCDTKNCIYAIICNGCNEFCVGETTNLRLRTNLHRDHINRNVGLYVSRHIAVCSNKSKKEKFSILTCLFSISILLIF